MTHAQEALILGLALGILAGLALGFAWLGMAADNRAKSRREARGYRG